MDFNKILELEKKVKTEENNSTKLFEAKQKEIKKLMKPIVKDLIALYSKYLTPKEMKNFITTGLCERQGDIKKDYWFSKMLPENIAETIFRTKLHASRKPKPRKKVKIVKKKGK